MSLGYSINRSDVPIGRVNVPPPQRTDDLVVELRRVILKGGKISPIKLALFVRCVAAIEAKDREIAELYTQRTQLLKALEHKGKK